jgi:hypothetical protein
MAAWKDIPVTFIDPKRTRQIFQYTEEPSKRIGYAAVSYGALYETGRRCSISEYSMQGAE